MFACDPSAVKAKTKGNVGLIDRWDRMKQSNEIELYGKIHADICNVPLYLLSGVRVQIRLTKASTFFFMNKDKESKSSSNF